MVLQVLPPRARGWDERDLSRPSVALPPKTQPLRFLLDLAPSLVRSFIAQPNGIHRTSTTQVAKRTQTFASSLQYNTSAYLSITLARSWLGVCLERQLLDFPPSEQPGQDFLWLPSHYEESRPLRPQLLIEILERFQKKRSPMKEIRRGPWIQGRVNGVALTC